MILLFSLLLYLLVQRWKWCLWLVLPLSIAFDLWRMDTLGTAGLQILAIFIAIWLITGPKVENYRLKI